MLERNPYDACPSIIRHKPSIEDSHSTVGTFSQRATEENESGKKVEIALISSECLIARPKILVLNLAVLGGEILTFLMR
jgi:hypothetical protein